MRLYIGVNEVNNETKLKVYSFSRGKDKEKNCHDQTSDNKNDLIGSKSETMSNYSMRIRQNLKTNDR